MKPEYNKDDNSAPQGGDVNKNKDTSLSVDNNKHGNGHRSPRYDKSPTRHKSSRGSAKSTPSSPTSHHHGSHKRSSESPTRMRRTMSVHVSGNSHRTRTSSTGSSGQTSPHHSPHRPRRHSTKNRRTPPHKRRNDHDHSSPPDHNGYAFDDRPLTKHEILQGRRMSMNAHTLAELPTLSPCMSTLRASPNAELMTPEPSPGGISSRHSSVKSQQFTFDTRKMSNIDTDCQYTVLVQQAAKEHRPNTYRVNNNNSAWGGEQMQADIEDFLERYANPTTELAVSGAVFVIGGICLCLFFATSVKVWLIIGSTALILGSILFLTGMVWYYMSTRKPRSKYDIVSIKVLPRDSSKDSITFIPVETSNKDTTLVPVDTSSEKDNESANHIEVL